MGLVIGRRVVFKSVGEVVVEDFKLREPSEDELLVKTEVTAISPGTETAFLMGLPNTPRKYPMYPGYSNVGVVVETGSSANFRVGELIASPTQHASYVLVKGEDVLKVPTGLSPDEATFFNLTSIALQGVRKARIDIGESVVVLGLGIIGQLALQLSLLAGALPVIGIDLYDYRCKVASDLGADYVVNPDKSDVIGEVLKVTEGRGADVVIEATGNPKAIPLALKLAGKYGRVIVLGSPRGITDGINFYTDVHRKGLIIIGAHASLRPKVDSYKFWRTAKEDQEIALRLIARRRVKVKELITAKLKYSEASRAYHMLIHEKDKVLGVLLDWRESS